MFEITFQHRETLDGYATSGKAWKDAVYDFTYENRFLVYHAKLQEDIVYIVIDLTTGYGSEIIRRKREYKHTEYRRVVPLLLKSIKYTGDTRYLHGVSDNPEKTIDYIFKIILPEFGYTVRREQIKLCKTLYRGLTGKAVSVCEAEVGTGKTLAYLVAGLMAKKYGSGAYGFDSPVTIATSSIELQKTLCEKEIPKLSQMLSDYGITDRPLTAVMRKGREHYFCRARYEDFMEKLKKYPKKYGKLTEAFESCSFGQRAFDLDGLKMSATIKARICVKNPCGGCPYASECRYRMFLNRSTDRNHAPDFQITNHNLYLTDLKLRGDASGQLLLQSNYVIIDEAHKFKEAAMSVFGEQLTENDIVRYAASGSRLCKKESNTTTYKNMLDELVRLNQKLFDGLKAQAEAEGDEKHITDLSSSDVARITKMIDLIERIEASRITHSSTYEINGTLLQKALAGFTKPGDKNIWLDTDENRIATLCCAPKNIGTVLRQNVWNRYASHALTSGTMSDGISFAFFERENGIDRMAKHLLTESMTQSPFDYERNTRLYIPADMPIPDNDSEEYIKAIGDRIVSLVDATNGHTAILFTSYKVLSAVYELTKDRLKDYDVICMTRSNKTTIADFRKAKNGILFASGSMWEGVDCIGDCLSSVIIPRLPFPLRTATMEQKKQDCANIQAFVQEYAVPEMLTKLRQGVGRLIRCESDTGLISILDSRAATGSYARKIADTLKKYPRVRSMEEIREFFRTVKSEDYFRN